MSTAIEVSSDNAEDVLDEYPELRREDVNFSSEVLAQLLWPHLRFNFYKGQAGGVFAEIRARFRVSSVFLELLTTDKFVVDGVVLGRDVLHFLQILAEEGGSLPPVYEVLAANGDAFLELCRGSFRIESGYNHCVLSEIAGPFMRDLRSEEVVPLGGSYVRVVRREVRALVGSELKGVLAVANAAAQAQRKVILNGV